MLDGIFHGGGDVGAVGKHRIHNGDVVGAHDIFEEVLIHADRGAEYTAAYIGNICKFEQTLHGAVFAESAVQYREDDIHFGKGLERGAFEGIEHASAGFWQQHHRVEVAECVGFKGFNHILAGEPGAFMRDANLGDIEFFRVEDR